MNECSIECITKTTITQKEKNRISYSFMYVIFQSWIFTCECVLEYRNTFYVDFVCSNSAFVNSNYGEMHVMHARAHRHTLYFPERRNSFFSRHQQKLSLFKSYGLINERIEREKITHNEDSKDKTKKKKMNAIGNNDVIKQEKLSRVFICFVYYKRDDFFYSSNRMRLLYLPLVIFFFGSNL